MKWGISRQCHSIWSWMLKVRIITIGALIWSTLLVPCYFICSLFIRFQQFSFFFLILLPFFFNSLSFFFWQQTCFFPCSGLADFAMLLEAMRTLGCDWLISFAYLLLLITVRKLQLDLEKWLMLLVLMMIHAGQYHCLHLHLQMLLHSKIRWKKF